VKLRDDAVRTVARATVRAIPHRIWTVWLPPDSTAECVLQELFIVHIAREGFKHAQAKKRKSPALAYAVRSWHHPWCSRGSSRGQCTYTLAGLPPCGMQQDIVRAVKDHPNMKFLRDVITSPPNKRRQKPSSN
jgi:hypothetical protein